ncbi:hypothetical protein [Actinomadura luteofluorescens]|uniref:hypothetical protein n=1 Tax=Actinomadura luteofluorescens TaxID=46163 RepID=UPI003D8F90B8
MSETTTRPFCCTRCGHQVRIGEEASVWADFGPAVIDNDGLVRAPQAEAEGYLHEPHEIHTFAVCPNPECGHKWRLRRPFDGGTSLKGAA